MLDLQNITSNGISLAQSATGEQGLTGRDFQVIFRRPDAAPMALLGHSMSLLAAAIDECFLGNCGAG